MRFSILHVASLLFALGNATPTKCPGPDLSGLIGQLLPTTVESSPNPIGTMYPGNVTGTINGTIAVVPIPYEEARSIIPAQYGILKNQYESMLPGFPKDKYPLMIRAILDHDVGLNGVQLLPDFQSVHIFYPFVDLLGDGYSPFSYGKFLILTNTNVEAQAGSAAYGMEVYPATFVPPNNAYAYAGKECGESGEIFFNAYTNLSSCPAVTTKYKPQPSIGPWPFEFYVNVTNQPIFANAVKCDQQVTLYNSSVSTGKNAPVGVTGDIFVAAPYLPNNKDGYFHGVHGLKVDIAFIENNMLDCSSLKGQ